MSNRDGKAPHRIDWQAAEEFYLSLDPPRVLQRVVEKFAVSRVSVGRQAKQRKWREKAERLDAAAVAGVTRRIQRTREQRITKVLGLVDSAIDGFDAQLDAKIAEAKLSDLPALVKLTELLEGEATDRVDVTRVQPLIAAFVVKVAVLVPADRDGELSAVLDWFEGELRALEPGEPGERAA